MPSVFDLDSVSLRKSRAACVIEGVGPGLAVRPIFLGATINPFAPPFRTA
jgi:hypothetical protein